MSTDFETAGRFLAAREMDLKISALAERNLIWRRSIPFSWRNPSNELQPGPPLSQIAISFVASGFCEGKNQNHSWFSSVAFGLMGRRPAYDSPILNSTSGKAVPLTANSKIN